MNDGMRLKAAQKPMIESSFYASVGNLAPEKHGSTSAVRHQQFQSYLRDDSNNTLLSRTSDRLLYLFRAHGNTKEAKGSNAPSMRKERVTDEPAFCRVLRINSILIGLACIILSPPRKDPMVLCGSKDSNSELKHQH